MRGLSEAPNRATIERRLCAWRVKTDLVILRKLDVGISRKNWTIVGISRKEFEAVRLCSELVFAMSKSLQHLSCSFTCGQIISCTFKWIVNPHLHHPRFVKRRVDKIHLMTLACN